MGVVLNKWRFMVVCFLIVFLLIFFIGRAIWKFDDDKPMVLRAIGKDKTIQEIIGGVKNVKMTSYTHFKGGGGKSEYKEIELLVRGEGGEVKVEVKVSGPAEARAVELKVGS